MTEIRTEPGVHGFLIGVASLPYTYEELVAAGVACVLDGTLEAFDVQHVLYLRALIRAGVIDPDDARTFYSSPPPL